MEMLSQKQKIIVFAVIAVVVVVIAYYYINSTKEIYVGEEIENVTNDIEEVIEYDKKIKVHITGAVKRNGIVEIMEKSRLADVIEEAGGLTEDADLTDVNLAYMVEDGQKIYIPSIDDRTEETEKYVEEKFPVISSGQENIVIDGYIKNNQLININKATVLELMELPGVGESTAAKIIEYRRKNGDFKKIEDIKNVSGLGEAKFNIIKSLITV